MGKPQSTCRDCKDRYVGCHSKCERYIEYRKELEMYFKGMKETRATEWIADIRPWMRRK